MLHYGRSGRYSCGDDTIENTTRVFKIQDVNPIGSRLLLFISCFLFYTSEID